LLCLRRGAAERRQKDDGSVFDSSAALQMLVQQAREEAGEDVVVSAAHDFRQVCLCFLHCVPTLLLAECVPLLRHGLLSGSTMAQQHICELQVDVPRRDVVDVAQLRRERQAQWRQLQQRREIQRGHDTHSEQGTQSAPQQREHFRPRTQQFARQ